MAFIRYHKKPAINNGIRIERAIHNMNTVQIKSIIPFIVFAPQMSVKRAYSTFYCCGCCSVVCSVSDMFIWTSFVIGDAENANVSNAIQMQMLTIIADMV